MLSELLIHRLPAFETNYLWLLARDGCAAAVDPGDAKPVLSALEKHGYDLRYILITHHHADHIGGIAALLKAFPNAQVYAPDDKRIAPVNETVSDGDTVTLDVLNLNFKVMEVPGHTTSHIAYYMSDKLSGNKLFCGDTLFACGCGRLFEGTPAQMHTSLSKIRALPDDTEVYCAHEYTLDNIEFALWVEPDNEALQARQKEAVKLRENGDATVPSQLGLEKQTNPFLRFDEPAVISAAKKFVGADAGRDLGGAEVFGAIREWKDTKFD